VSEEEGWDVGRYGCRPDGLDELNTMVRAGGREGGREKREGRDGEGVGAAQTVLSVFDTGTMEGGREGGRAETYLVCILLLKIAS